MDQNNPNDPNSGINSGFGTGVSGTTGSGSASTGSSFSAGGTGSGMGSGGTMSSGSVTNSGGLGVTSASEGTGSRSEVCPHCGQAMNRGGVEQFLSRLGINEEMIENLRGQFANVDIDEYLNTAREYLKGSSDKASTYAKENPGKVAAGVAALALGAGLIFAKVNRGK